MPQPTIEPEKIGILIIPNQINSPLPLQRTQVNAHITAMIAVVTMTQSFSNPLNAPIELEYLFPLPEKAALVDFSFQIGPRTIRAELQETHEAQTAYERARENGQQAALLDQRRPNLFAIRLANVLPEQPIQVMLSYEDHLELSTDALEFVFPMGITPKYHPSGHKEESLGVDAPVALPGEKIGPVEITVTAALGQKTGQPTSPSHALIVDPLGHDGWSIALDGSFLPDHDFVLRFPISDASPQPATWTTQDSAGEIALLHWLPVLAGEPLPAAQPRELIFVLDRSGSMSGQPILQARNALRACLRILEPHDNFRILLFDDQLEWFSSQSLAVTQEHIDQADRYLNTIEGRGGTEIIAALEEVLGLPGDKEKSRFVIFLTDGAVSAEERAFQTIRARLKGAKIFTFGIGPSVNRALLSKLARLGRGSAEFLQLDEDIEGAIIRFQDRISFPVLTDLQVEWVNASAWDVYPAPLPDVYAGQSLQMVARLKRKSPSSKALLKITAMRARERIHMEVPLETPDPDLHEISRAWAHARIDDLLEQSSSQADTSQQFRQEIIQLALEHRLVTPYTAFVALDSAVVNPNGEMLSVQVSQPLPAGLDREGFFPAPPPQFLMAAAMPLAQPRNRGKATRASMKMSASENGSQYPLGDHQAGFIQPPQSSQPDNEIFTEDQHLVSGTPDANQTLRWLARTQNLDGSWNEGVEFTAAALIAYVRHGHTTRAGHFRKQVSRAAAWLSQASWQGNDAFACALALYDLASADAGFSSLQPWQQRLAALPAPQTDFQRMVTARLHPGSSLPSAPEAITDLESLRSACAARKALAIPPIVWSHDQPALIRVWAAALAADA